MINTFITNTNTNTNTNTLISLQLLHILRILQTFEYHLIYEQFAMEFAEIQSSILKTLGYVQCTSSRPIDVRQ